MERRHVLIIGGSLSALVLLYCLSFGPVAYLWGKAADHGLVPNWLDDGLSVVFHPHLWCMYHVEGYFDYIVWFLESATGPQNYIWKDFRDSLDNPNG